MKEQIYTIPLNESFDSGDECPFCFLERNVERSAINYAVGPEASYMESDVRGLTNEQGFCTHHMKALYDYGNALGSALILQSYYKLLMDDFRDQIEHFDQPAKRGLFARAKQESDDAMPPLPRLELQRDPVARGEVVEWLVDIELEVLALYGCHELSHLGIGNGDHLLVSITVVVQSQTGISVPFGLDDGLNSPCRCLYEHEAMQVTTQTMLVFCRDIVFIGKL